MMEKPVTPPPLLSVCIPTHNRPDLLRRTLKSIKTSKPGLIEAIVSDNLDNGDSREVVEQVFSNVPFRWTYVVNDSQSGSSGNANKCIDMASGKYVYLIHDDDFLYPEGLDILCESLQNINNQYKVVKFGVRLADLEGRAFRKQTCKKETYLKPDEAYRRLLNNSSWIRFPSMVVAKSAYDDIGRYDPAFKGADDFDMWIRLLAEYGVYCVPDVISAYTIHQAADTVQMFNEQTVEILLQLFEKAKEKNLVEEKDLAVYKANFFHQFILSGTVRSLRNKDAADARRIMSIFRMDSLRDLELSFKWMSVRLLLNLVTYERSNFTTGRVFAKYFKTLSN